MSHISNFPPLPFRHFTTSATSLDFTIEKIVFPNSATLQPNPRDLSFETRLLVLPVQISIQIPQRTVQVHSPDLSCIQSQNNAQSGQLALNLALHSRRY